MKLAKQVGLTVVALAAIAGAAYFGAKAAAVAVFGTIKVLRAGNSPIMASGGSMTFRSAVGWTCDGNPGSLHQRCITTQLVGIDAINWDSVIPDPDTGMRTVGWSGLSNPWDVIMRARANGNNGRVRICTTATATLASATCDVDLASPPSYTRSYLLLTLLGASANGGNLALIESKATDMNGLTAVQYYDSACVVHPAPAGNISVADCEHPGKIETSLDKGDKYKCQHGACQIGVE